MSHALPFAGKSKLALVALLLAPALLAGCNSRDAQMSEQIANANAAAMRAEQAAQRAEKAAANAQQSQPSPPMEVEADPEDDQNAQPQPQPQQQTADVRPDSNVQNVVG